jgi:hypothetical protein
MDVMAKSGVRSLRRHGRREIGILKFCVAITLVLVLSTSVATVQQKVFKDPAEYNT